MQQREYQLFTQTKTDDSMYFSSADMCTAIHPATGGLKCQL